MDRYKAGSAVPLSCLNPPTAPLYPPPAKLLLIYWQIKVTLLVNYDPVLPVHP